MYLERLTLTNFRSYAKKSFTFAPACLISAPNGSGKSNLLEAINLLATGVSERAGRIEEMIRFGEEVASVVGVVRAKDGTYTELTVVLTRGMVAGKRSPKRRYLVDGVPRLQSLFVGKLVAMLFAPEDMRLIEGSKERRRRYLDSVLSQAHTSYARALSTYEAALKRRNRLLDQIREGRASVAELAYWDQSIVKNGTILCNYRRDYLTYLSEQVETAYGEYRLNYVASPVSPERLTAHLDAEIALGYTLVGPHKDDFEVYEVEQKSERNLMIYGSRGEQRLAVLHLKVGAMSYLEAKLAVTPIILLDDIFSELDEQNREAVLSLSAKHQTIITTAELNLGIETGALDRVDVGREGSR